MADKEAKENDFSYKGLDTKYILYIIFVVVAIAGILFLVQKIDSAMHPISMNGHAVYTPEVMNKYLDNPDEIIALFQKTSDEIPGTLKAIFGNERINTKITRMDGTVVDMAVVTKRGQLSEVTVGTLDEPTMLVEISEDIIKKIYEAKSPVDAVEEALETEEIKYDSQRFTTTVKIGILNTVINIMSWFA